MTDQTAPDDPHGLAKMVRYLADPARVRETRAIAKVQAGNLSRRLGIEVRWRGVGHTRAQHAGHEAAHAVVALALGGGCAFVHVGRTFGGLNLSLDAEDGLVMAYGLAPEGTTTCMAAGMVWDESAWIGLQDARTFLAAAETLHLDEVRALHDARRRAKAILREHIGAVVAVGALLAAEGTLLERDLRVAAARASKFPPPRARTRAGRVVVEGALFGEALPDLVNEEGVFLRMLRAEVTGTPAFARGRAAWLAREQKRALERRA